MNGLARTAPASTSHSMAKPGHGGRNVHTASLEGWVEEMLRKGIGRGRQGLEVVDISLR